LFSFGDIDDHELVRCDRVSAGPRFLTVSCFYQLMRNRRDDEILMIGHVSAKKCLRMGVAASNQLETTMGIAYA